MIRTLFLLDYISKAPLRAIIQEATTKSERFNGFAQWIAFGGEGLPYQNDRDEQRKLIKYNHLVANLVILHNVQSLTTAINELGAEGITIDPKILSQMSPYLTAHINRFGDYRIDLTRKPQPVTYKISRAFEGPNLGGKGPYLIH